MATVFLALLPTLIAGTILMGSRALSLSAVCVLSSVLFEFLWNKLLKKENTVSDFSAAVTGLLIALNVPVTLPYYMAIIGCGFAIIVVKQFFGGLGHNFVNPALAARAFLLASFGSAMTSFLSPGEIASIFGSAATAASDAVSYATPLAALKSGSGDLVSYADLFFGNVGGSLGEVSAFAILIGAAVLVWRKIIKLYIPIAYLVTLMCLGYISGGDGVYQILCGGVMLGAFFMATDYTTSPTTAAGQILFGFGCGAITFIIRKWGGYPEGVTYAILLMNIVTPLIDKYIRPRIFGTVKTVKEEKAKEGALLPETPKPSSNAKNGGKTETAETAETAEKIGNSGRVEKAEKAEKTENSETPKTKTSEKSKNGEKSANLDIKAENSPKGGERK